MKISKIIGIVCWSLVAVFLTSILITALVGRNVPFKIFSFNVPNNISFNSENMSETSSYTFPIDDIDSISVDWSSGKIEIIPSEDKEIKVIEYADRELEQDKKMLCKVNGSTLVVDYDSRNGFFSIFNFDLFSKYVKIHVPKALLNEMKNIDIDSASADVYANDFSAEKLKASTASGNITLGSASAQILEFDTASGDISINDFTCKDRISANSASGNITISKFSVQNSTLETVSGEINLNDFNCEEKISVNSTSGGIKLLNTSANTFDAGSVSGDIEFNGKVKIAELESVSGNQRVTSSVCPEKVQGESVSGDIRINVPKDSGFTAKLDSVSGDLKCSIAGVMSDRQVVVGNGNNEMKFDTTSGNVNIEND